ncbi:TPA: DNA-binding transcriptional repressor XynR [Enterobacter roggenkampii]|uniref:DNA-binding transcriptional repressor XynR n=1 Tax=Enterobacter TaxID=547 RepID=UPI0008A4774D|nr:MULTISPECIES: DNA-binding transcriptional repressor XynR [Enterobacter]MCE5965389.1 DNA-binding transcriptional repressor XynR [Enterobacter roggenkampii]MCE5970009.1 DNA-binding transcriptional repressor XynR [Enterobacter roggenkampii]MCK7076221.1 DNA-binding transcriptional repressor XynR [Enterobacter roggenkampii]MCM7572848.1 DNA-binding transcriptional repressor XynR [Enterobacter roggenkampii]MCO6656633.1 DNA-binding transcriptional repressor XynR [Enterobacter roggenkampii]
MPIIQSVERALQILDLFNEQATELKITDISKLMGLSKSTLHSLLKTLQLHGYIDQNPENGKYRLGMKLVERGHFVVGSIDIRQKAKGWLTELSQRTGQTTHLGILDGREGVYIEKIEGKLAAIAYSRIGRRLPVHATAIGKVLIAWLGETELNALLEGYQYTTFTPATLSSREALISALAQTREQGYALDSEENEQGVRCVAVPVWNHESRVIAALSLSTLTSRVDDAELANFREQLQQAGLALSRALGYPA